MDNNDRVPTLAECLEEWKQKKPLLEDIDVLEQEREPCVIRSKRCEHPLYK